MTRPQGNLEIIVIEGAPGAATERCRKIDVRLSARPGPIHVRLLAPDRPLRLAEAVPVARQMCDAMLGRVLSWLGENGLDVPCKKGCHTCCRFLVPLSPPEAFRLAEEIDALPQPQRDQTRASFARAEQVVVTGGRPRLNTPAGPADDGNAVDRAIGAWWNALNLDCPLLSEGQCRSYATRPLACRSYFETVSPTHCARPGAARRLRSPVSFVSALCELTARLERRPQQAVLMPLAPSWARENAARAQRTWPAAVLLGTLAEAFQDLSRRAAA